MLYNTENTSVKTLICSMENIHLGSLPQPTLSGPKQ